MDITPIVTAFIGLLMAILTSFIIPWLKSKINSQQFGLLSTYAYAAVQAAEVLIKGSGQGSKKLQYATEQIQEFCNKNGIKIDSNTVRIVIENAWKELNLDKGKS